MIEINYVLLLFKGNGTRLLFDGAMKVLFDAQSYLQTSSQDSCKSTQSIDHIYIHIIATGKIPNSLPSSNAFQIFFTASRCSIDLEIYISGFIGMERSGHFAKRILHLFSLRLLNWILLNNLSSVHNINDNVSACFIWSSFLILQVGLI